MSRYRSLIRQLLQLGAVVTLCVVLAPWLLTYQHYLSGQTAIAPNFPIAIRDQGSVSVVLWREYQQSPTRYAPLLLTEGRELSWPLEDGSAVRLLQTPDGLFDLTYYTSHYVFWARYQIQSGTVQPISLRYTGAFIIFPLLLLAATAYLTIMLLRKLYRPGHR
ncbi:hypothetical protein ACFOSS_12110 [Pseudaeromonas sharmana]|uniref:Uncharacterized protein n=1 Tax=Pseudaeromonas sharmana TaxID=328412 RepID=A0ABV8CQN3_9GAMM